MTLNATIHLVVHSRAGNNRFQWIDSSEQIKLKLILMWLTNFQKH